MPRATFCSTSFSRWKRSSSSTVPSIFSLRNQDCNRSENDMSCLQTIRIAKRPTDRRAFLLFARAPGCARRSVGRFAIRIVWRQLMSFSERLQSWFRNEKIDGTVDDELRFHLEKEVEQNVARGMSPDEARRQASISFGGVQQTRETLRQVRRT